VRRDSILIIGILAIALGLLGLSVQPRRAAINNNASLSPDAVRMFDSISQQPPTGTATMPPDGSHRVRVTRPSGRENIAR
jgi:hypothetical protein